MDWSGWNNAVVDLGEDNERLLVFTWNVELDDRTQRYGGWVAHAAPDNALGYTYTMLEHDRNVDPQDDSRMHRHDHWQGGLYYAGVLQHDRDDPVHLARMGRRRRLDHAKVDRDGGTSQRTWRFGAPRFDMPQGLQKRVVLAYADAVQATLRVESELGRIVYDHLAPEDPSFQGQHAFYGPTLSYDGLEWRKGRWHFTPDLAVKNSDDNSPREYRDPSRRRRRN